MFDEIDHLEDANTLLYELPRARANGHITDATVGVLGISTDDTFRQTLSPTVTGTPMDTESFVSPSDAAALRTMSEYWADRAVVDVACDTTGIAKEAALAAQEVENARQALDLRRVGAELAEQHGEAPVTDSLETVRERVQRGRGATEIRDQMSTCRVPWKRSRISRRAVRSRRGRRSSSERPSRWQSRTPPRRCRR
ncbi:cell division control protein 6-like protein [Halorubrum ezzemoulense]|uniref:cell division control protein 6-like protein n=1 Tax=Halorubrum ezzemoulense TaxID=337243 RepID=UPI00232D3430|nr:cell division control protein 6-like protein [Halorubrum ezzemoulense]MDB2280133.1 cell division control protein 6-like protein [Halorubrum ezzemoulense]MDB2290551.1 cell division control protein 6-like protein [Halorubrum ezzemoulense]MDB2298025.1 cell division control protein 6-like protein [Halorubrum ezzemoulense]MDB2301466.1 cell division control protein 6-like protein [Halorubrum ezzemoulense]